MRTQGLTAALIARDEASRIGRCLDSLQGVVDAVLVADTGSIDNTPVVARARGAHVLEVPWRDDFAWARNQVLAQVRTTWALIIDADEWLEDGHRWLRVVGRQPAAFLGVVTIRSASRLGNRRVESVSAVARVIPSDVRYAGRIHEQPVPVLGEERIPVTLGHDGYSGKHAEAKRARNIQLLQRALADDPDSIELLYHMGKECQALGDAEGASSRFTQVMQSGIPEVPWRHAFVVRAIAVFAAAGRIDQALRLAEVASGEFEDSPDFCFVVGEAFAGAAYQRPREAATLLTSAQEQWRRCLTLGDRPEADGSVLGRGSFLAAHNLALACDALNQTADAARYRRLARIGGRGACEPAEEVRSPQGGGSRVD